MKAKELFTEELQKQVVAAIETAELNTSGEVRVHLDDNCKGEVLDRAAYVFEKLEMHKTEQRNGVPPDPRLLPGLPHSSTGSSTTDQ